MKRIAIIGGGISGLSAALALEQHRQAGAPLEYRVFESSPRFGGVISSERVNGCVVEAGPDSFLTEKPWASALCHQIGLGDQLIGSNDAGRKTYILVNGRLVAVPEGLMFMIPTKFLPALTSQLFSVRTKLKIAREWLRPPQSSKADESVASLVERHYGAEMVGRLADPLLSGVYGGEASQLSVHAVLPRLRELETEYGSLSRGILATRKRALTATAGAAGPMFTSLKNGMQQLLDALLARLPAASLQASAQVTAVQPQGGGWLLSAGYGSDEFDALIIATTAQAAAALLRTTNADLAQELGGIGYSSSVTITLGYDQQVRSSLPGGFGFLVPRSEGKRLMAATFVHNKFPHRAPETSALIRCFLGGTRDESALELCDEEILRIVREELRQILGLTAEPLFTRVYKWKAAMAQYSVGHLERLDRIEWLRKHHPGLALAGNGYRGIGVPDCVRSGQQAAGQVLAATGLAHEIPS